MRLIKVMAPAKINLGLEIYQKYPSGYHEVKMIMQSISLCDELEIYLTNSQNIQVFCEPSILCAPKDNLTYKAASKFFKYSDIKNPGIKICIKKNIPHAAGLAGGSADAAATLVGLNKLYGTDFTNEILCNIGAQIGSDVPFCIMGGSVHAFGTGCDMQKLSGFPKCHLVVVKPSLRISTASAYELADKYSDAPRKDLIGLKKAVNSQNLKKICCELFNRFESVLDEKIIFDIKSNLQSSGALGAVMSGSGSAVVGIFDCEQKANSCALLLNNKYGFAKACVPMNHGAIVI